MTETKDRCAGTLFSQIRGIFAGLGILGRDLVISHDGVSYRVSCDEKSFVVYRVNSDSGTKHHVPGWPVCMVSSDVIFEECSSPYIGRDHCACGLDLEKWLEIIRNHNARGLPSP
ncbi:MAG: hypothetical protein HY912_11290 [Desulfomonile tiedjei]|uniref:Uncharacterized protein n=1 Tax=Desulfomonile tiedjei TaxID=2358 RepID=A0A9D6Z6F2_9BACT|nr:hypothetical protein [Desulfomonile tiedjei]